MPNILHLHGFWRKFSSLLVSAAVRIFSSLGTRTMRDSKPWKGRIGLAISETFWWLSMEVTLVIRTWEQWGSQQVVGWGSGGIWSDLVGCGWCWLGFSCSRVWNQKSWYSLCWYNCRHGFSKEDVYESCAVRDRILQMADFDGVDVGTLPWSTGHPEMPIFISWVRCWTMLIHVDPSSSVVLPGSAIETRWLHTKLLRGEGPLSLLPDSCWHIALDEPALRVLSKALVYGDHFALFCNM